MAFIKINKQNFFHNLNQIALKTGSKKKIAIVLKDNAYGHGLELMAKLASEYGITQAVVRTSTEASKIQTFFEDILILGDRVVKHPKYTFAINTLADIRDAQSTARVTLKVDTGMHRNGIVIEEIEEAIAQIKEQNLNLVAVMTHYRSADEMGSEWFWQKKNFEHVKKTIKALGYDDIHFHSHNSASILRCKHFDEDLVRVGIGAYGYNELPKSFDRLTLKPILSLHAKKVSTRLLKKGQRVGYGGDFIAPRDMHISTYNLGYGDGWHRGNSKSAYVTAENLPILGRVSMDLIALESHKDEICVMNDAQHAAKQLGTISYEITTALDAGIEKSVI